MDFYREFHSRLNSLVFEYIEEDPATVISILWEGFPVARYLLLVLILWLLLQWIFGLADSASKHGTSDSPATATPRTIAARTAASCKTWW